MGAGMNMGAHKMPLLGQFFENPHEAKLRQTMHEAGDVFQGYRPEAADAQLRGMEQTYSLFQPTNQALGQMYGPGAQFDTSTATQNPISDRMFAMGDQRPWRTAGKGERRGQTLGMLMGGMGAGIEGTVAGGGIGKAIGKRRDRKRGG